MHANLLKILRRSFWRMSNRQTHGAFTSVEAVMATGLLAVLGLLVLPSLNTAKIQADAARCMTNERQLGMAVLAYTFDHNNRVPPRYNWGPSWADYLIQGGYITNYTQFTCPVRLAQGVTSMVNSYGWSDWLDLSGNGCAPVYMHNVPVPEQTPLIADCNNYRFNNHSVVFLLVPRHSGKINMLWLDGHVTLITTTELATNPYWGQRFVAPCY